jgi:GWxTD domain-containing protein
MRKGAALALVLVVALSLISPAPGAPKTPKLEDWHQGPVRYIALAEEVKTYRDLTTDAQRALFIERFWARRDPDPTTLVNEVRQSFWLRVQEANTNFLDSSKPGWMTDRGKIHILYGPPNEIQQDVGAQTEATPTTGRGLIRWIYEGRPGGRMDLDPVVIVPFVPDAGGEYHVSYDPKLASIFFNPLAMDARTPGDPMLQMLGTPSRSGLSVMLDLGKMQEVPPQEQVLLERVETIESYEMLPVDAGVHRYQPADSPGSTTVVITADIGRVPRDAALSILARLVPQDATRQTRMLGEDSFRIAEDGTSRLAQGRLQLDPGTWTLTLIVTDAKTAATGIVRRPVTVPGDSSALRLSDLAWASRLESLPYASLASYDEPFHVGPFRVLPRLSGTYRVGETIRLFYEIYGGRPPYRVAYQLEGRDEDGGWVALGRPTQGEQSAAGQGWEQPTTERWPLGEYRVRIEIEDRDAARVVADQPFRIEASAP